jgi:pectate lyase
MAIAGGLAVRVRGLTRWLGLMLGGSGTVSLIRSSFDHREVLAEAPGSIDTTLPHRLRLEALGSRIRGFVDGQLLFDIADADTSRAGGAVALICEEGRIESGDVTVAPLAATHGTSGPSAHASPGHPLVDAR